VSFEVAGGQTLKAIAHSAPTGKETEVAVRTAYIGIGRSAAGDNQIPGTVRRRMFHGDFTQYVVDCASGSMIVRLPPTHIVDEGANVTLMFPAQYCVLLEA
jgi:iron(III) transport system ATP-binding protein